MDTMNIKTGFMRTIISKVINKIIKKKLGYDLNVSIEDLCVINTEEGVTFDIKVRGSMKHEELKGMIEEYI